MSYDPPPNPFSHRSYNTLSFINFSLSFLLYQILLMFSARPFPSLFRLTVIFLLFLSPDLADFFFCRRVIIKNDKYLLAIIAVYYAGIRSGQISGSPVTPVCGSFRTIPDFPLSLYFLYVFLYYLTSSAASAGI